MSRRYQVQPDFRRLAVHSETRTYKAPAGVYLPGQSALYDPGDALLLEDGFLFLLESGDNLLLEPDGA